VLGSYQVVPTLERSEDSSVNVESSGMELVLVVEGTWAKVLLSAIIDEELERVWSEEGVKKIEGLPSYKRNRFSLSAFPVTQSRKIFWEYEIIEWKRGHREENTDGNSVTAENYQLCHPRGH
jgi:hypothetical protein